MLECLVVDNLRIPQHFQRMLQFVSDYPHQFAVNRLACVDSNVYKTDRRCTVHVGKARPQPSPAGTYTHVDNPVGLLDGLHHRSEGWRILRSCSDRRGDERVFGSDACRRPRLLSGQRDGALAQDQQRKGAGVESAPGLGWGCQVVHLAGPIDRSSPLKGVARR